MKSLVVTYVSQALKRIESDPNALDREGMALFGVQHRRADSGGRHGGGGIRTEQSVLVE